MAARTDRQAAGSSGGGQWQKQQQWARPETRAGPGVRALFRQRQGGTAQDALLLVRPASWAQCGVGLGHNPQDEGPGDECKAQKCRARKVR